VRKRAGWTVAAMVAVAALVVAGMWLSRPGGTDAGADPTKGVAVPAARTAAVEPARPAPPAVRTLHYVSNTGTRIGPATGLGFDLFDTGPDRARVDALGPGRKALVWLGNLDNTDCTPGYSWHEFTAAVDRLAHDPAVFGYYLSDEPHPGLCSGAVADIRARADYIRAHAPGQKSFIVVMDASRICGADPGCEYRQLNPAATHVDLIGIDPFPCHVGAGCDPSRVEAEVGRAVEAGIPVRAMVPVFQVFGQSCAAKTAYYRQPSAVELTEILDRWQDLVPHPVFDYAYTWRSEGPACPSLDRSKDLWPVVSDHNRA
jgi:hypothetical protein